MKIIVKVAIDHNLSHLGGKPPKGSEKGGVFECGMRNGEGGTIKK